MRAATCLVMVACVWLSLLAPDAFADTLSAPGGVAAGGDIRDSTITITGIISPEQLAVITEALKREQKLTDDQRKIIADLEGKLGVSAGALQAFFAILGEADVPPEKQPARLIEIAEDYNRVRQQVAAAPGDPPAVAGLKAEARAALDAGELVRADDLLAQVLAAEDAAIEQRRLDAAWTSAQRGGIALTRLRYPEAAEHFAAAAARVPAGHDDQRLAYLDQEADAYYRQGDEFGDNGALFEAIHRYRAALTEYTRERVPLDWAAAQNHLGNALLVLGQRESGTERLEEAIVAFRAALGERTRARVPLDWAATQNNLGGALLTLGKLESGTQRLEEAVTALREALKERTRERVPLKWAATQANLGNALSALGERESGTQRLEEAVVAFRAALQEFTRERVPLQWAGTQNNLGHTLRALGESESGTERLDEAVTALCEALKERTRERVPLDWAATQANLGNALSALGERESGTQRLDEAVVAFRAALQEFTRERVPRDWAGTQNNLGNALSTLGQRESGTERLEEAIVAFRAALTERTRDRVPLDWAGTQTNLSTALGVLGARTGDPVKLAEARKAVEGAFEVFMLAGQEKYRSYFENRLSELDRQIAELTPPR